MTEYRPTEQQVDAAMDAFHAGEDWRKELGPGLEPSRLRMRAALVAAASVSKESGPDRITDGDGAEVDRLRAALQAIGAKREREWIGEDYALPGERIGWHERPTADAKIALAALASD